MFYRLLAQYVVSSMILWWDFQEEDLSTTTLKQDPISVFFDIRDCPQILNTPIELNPLTGEILRQSKNLNLENVYDEYDQTFVPLKQLLDQVFYEHGRVRPHERIFCWFPKFFEYYLQTIESLMSDNCILSLEAKFYLGVMAVSCYSCEYLLNILEEHFILNGGNLDWITGGLKFVD